MNTTTDEHASQLVLKADLLTRAKSLSNLREVFRSAQLTLLLADALACGLRIEAEALETVYGDPAGRKYWKTQLSEPMAIHKLAYTLSVHVAENIEQLESAKLATLLAFRDAAEAGEDWFVGDTAPLLALENAPFDFGSLPKVKVHPRAAVEWLLSKPKRQHLVAESLRRFLQVDELSEASRPISQARAERFVDDYINNAQGQGRRPSIEGLEAAAKDAGIRGGREFLRTAFNQRMGGRRGRPAKLSPKTAKK